MIEYKVLTQKDRFFSSKFSPEKLQEVINDYAEEGWRVISITSGEFPGMLKSRNEIVVVLEREKAE
jgi:hypothetical protein